MVGVAMMIRGNNVTFKLLLRKASFVPFHFKEKFQSKQKDRRRKNPTSSAELYKISRNTNENKPQLIRSGWLLGRVWFCGMWKIP